MVWLPVFGIFNVCTDTDACDCTQGLYGRCKSLHCKFLILGEKRLAAPGTWTCVSILPGLFSWLLYQLNCPHPTLQLAMGPCRTRSWCRPRAAKGSPFKAWSRSKYSLACFANSHNFFLCNFNIFGPFIFIFFRSSPLLPWVLGVVDAHSHAGLWNNVDHLAHHNNKCISNVLNPSMTIHVWCSKCYRNKGLDAESHAECLQNINELQNMTVTAYQNSKSDTVIWWILFWFCTIYVMKDFFVIFLSVEGTCSYWDTCVVDLVVFAINGVVASTVSQVFTFLVAELCSNSAGLTLMATGFKPTQHCFC